MSSGAVWGVLWVAASAVHVGFQLTVTCLVYPGLAEVAPHAWVPTHQRHSRRIAPLVGVVYVAVLVATTARLLSDPSPLTLLAAVCTGAVFGLTALAAAPLHRRLEPSGDARLMSRLVLVDRGRSVFAVGALAAAVVDVWSRTR